MKYDNLKNYKCLARSGEANRFSSRMPFQYRYSTYAIDDFLEGKYDFFTMHTITLDEPDDDSNCCVEYKITLDLCITDCLRHICAPILDVPDNTFVLSDFFKDGYFYESEYRNAPIYKAIMAAVENIDLKSCNKGDMFPLKNTIRVAAQDSWLHMNSVGDYDTYYITHIAIGNKFAKYLEPEPFDRFIDEIDSEISKLELIVEELEHNSENILGTLYSGLEGFTVVYKKYPAQILKANAPYKIQLKSNDKTLLLDLKFCIIKGFIIFQNSEHKALSEQYKTISDRAETTLAEIKHMYSVKAKAKSCSNRLFRFKESLSDIYMKNGFDYAFKCVDEYESP